MGVSQQPSTKERPSLPMSSRANDLLKNYVPFVRRTGADYADQLAPSERLSRSVGKVLLTSRRRSVERLEAEACSGDHAAVALNACNRNPVLHSVLRYRVFSEAVR